MMFLSSLGSLGRRRSFSSTLDLFLAGEELFFLFLGHVLHFGVFGFDDHFVGAGKVFFDLLELAVFFDDLLEIGVLLGELLELRRVGNDFGRGELLGHLLVAEVELVELFSECKCSHVSVLQWDYQFKVES